MSIGSVVVQPQRLARSDPHDSTAAAFGDVAKLALGILLDGLGGGHILEQFEAAGEAAAERLIAQAHIGLDHARGRLAAMVETPIARLQTLAQELGAIDDPDAALAAAHDVFAALTAAAEELTIDHIRQHVAEALDIIETDLGLTPSFLEDEVWGFFDDLVERLEHVAPEADESLRSNRLQVIGALRRLRRRVGDAFEFPQLDAEHASEDLFALIRRSGISEGAARAACVGANLAEAAQSGRDLLHAVPFTGFLPGSVGGAVVPEPRQDNDKYLWYPSWLVNNHPVGWDYTLIVPDNEVRLNAAKTQIVQRNSTRADQLIAAGTNLQWKDHPRLGDDPATYTFKHVDADAMESVARVTAIIQSSLDALLHLLSLEEGDYASNLVNMFGGTLWAIWKVAEDKPPPWWLEGLIVRTFGTFFASLEGIQTKASGRKFMMWLTLAGPDYAEMLTWRYITRLARNLLLSVLTLTNHQKPSGSGAHPRNREEFDAVRHVFTLALHNLLLLAFKRKNWGVMKDASSPSPALELIFVWSLVIGTLTGLAGGFVGSLLGEVIAGDVDLEPTKNKMWLAIPQAVLLTPFWLYLQQEGSTSGGTFTPYSGAAFHGYPPKSTSPYKLPYDSTAVGSCYVGQANQGLWSHNFNNVQQVYAYDFSLDEDSEILAARGGTVIQFSESVPNEAKPPWQTYDSTLTKAIPNGTSPNTIEVASVTDFAALGSVQIGSDTAYYTSIAGKVLQGVTWHGGGTTAAYAIGDRIEQTIFGWNFIVIKHDVAVADHDVGQGGAAIPTVAVYGHGMPGSVSAAFQLHNPPVPTAAILGHPVKQGMPIMLAGDTGVSFHNHLHMHVVEDPGGPYTGFGGNGNTIPFVFSDEDVPGDGVLKHFDWYRSANLRTQA